MSVTSSMTPWRMKIGSHTDERADRCIEIEWGPSGFPLDSRQERCCSHRDNCVAKLIGLARRGASSRWKMRRVVSSHRTLAQTAKQIPERL